MYLNDCFKIRFGIKKLFIFKIKEKFIFLHEICNDSFQER